MIGKLINIINIIRPIFITIFCAFFIFGGFCFWAFFLGEILVDWGGIFWGGGAGVEGCGTASGGIAGKNILVMGFIYFGNFYFFLLRSHRSNLLY